jgi:hypothetical protein
VIGGYLSDQIEDTETMQLSPDTGLVKGSLENTVQRILDLANSATAERPLSEVPRSRTG